MGKAMFTVISAIAEFERALISERVRAGLAKARAAGKPHGRPKINAQVIQEIRRLRRQGQSLNQIARTLSISHQTVANHALRRPPRAVRGFSHTAVVDGMVMWRSSKPHVIQVNLWLRVERNNKYVRGQKKAREDTERSVLSRYQMEKLQPNGWEYVLTMPDETDEGLDTIIYDDILREASDIAEGRHCFIEADVWSVEDPDRSW